MRRRPLLLLLLVTCALSLSHSADGTTDDRPTTQPAGATTRPASLKDARRIVFLVDTRVGLWPVFKAVREELGSAVTNLRDDQFFTLIVLRERATPSVFSQNPIRADEAAKKAASEFVAAMQTQHTTNPIPGIAKAVDLQPDVLCLIVGDDFPQTDAVRRTFQPFHGTLNVFLFTPYLAHPNEFLRTLAVEHHGLARDQRGTELEPPKPPPPPARGSPKPESRPSVLER